MKDIESVREKLNLINTGKIKSILLINFNNLGDLICDTPSIRNLRRYYQKEKIILLVRNGSCMELMNNFEYIDEVLEMPHSRDDLSVYYDFCKKIKKYNFVLSIQFVRPFNEVNRTYIPYMLNIPMRLGLLQETYLEKYKNAFTNYLVLKNDTTRIEESLNLVKLLGIEIDSSKTECFINRKNIMHFNHRNYIIVQVCATMKCRMWHKYNFINLIKLILEKYEDIDILLTGVQAESKYIDYIVAKVNNYRVYKYTNINLDTLLNYIKHARLVITNDTGPFHFARAFDTKRIVLFGISPRSYLINTREKNSLELCGNNKCPANCFVSQIEKNCNKIYKVFGEQYNCINTINYIDVFNKVVEMLND